MKKGTPERCPDVYLAAGIARIAIIAATVVVCCYEAGVVIAAAAATEQK